MRKKKRLHKRTTIKRSFTAKKVQDLELFSDAIGRIIPATSFGNAFCFQRIAKENHLSKYWESGKNKKEQISHFFKSLYKYHPKLMYKILREHISKGIDRRHRQGNPVLKAEMDAIDSILKRLNVNLTREFNELNLPTERPKIVPPPIEYQKMIENASLSNLIAEKCIKLFKDGHLNESVRKALEILEKYVQNLSGLKDAIGKDLMMNAFNEATPLIKINVLSDKKDISQQEGFKFIAAGVMLFWRNKFSHGDEDQASYIDAYEMLLSVNHILRTIENSPSLARP